MCGIAGIVRFDGGSVSPSDAETMIACLRHRGPDGSGVWTRGPAAFGHTRLRVIDLSAASDQPFLNDDGSIALVYNGEIYNYRELRRDLTAKGHHFRTSGDTEVVLRAYEEWGPECPSRFNGMFAIAIWDDSKKRLFLSRDRFGEKPLFYRVDDGRLLFASEMKSLLRVNGARRNPNLANLHQYLSTGDLDLDETTFIEGVHSAPPAHSLIWGEKGRSRRLCYWRPQPAARRKANSAERVEEFRALLEDSVRIRLRGDVSVGTSLSGGLDSSSIVCLVRDLSESQAAPRRTFSARFRNHEFDEGAYIEAVTAVAPAEAHETWVEAEGFPAALPALQWAQEAPIGGTSVYAQWEVMKLAHEHGTIVLLDGQGADELLGGYVTAYGMYWSHLLYRGSLWRLSREIAAFVRRYGVSPVAALYSIYYSVPSGIRGALAERYYRSTKVMSREIRSQEPGNQELHLPGLQRLHGLLARQLLSTSLPELLRYADRNSMAFSREVRLPFLDHRLVEFVLGLPAEDLIRGAVSKDILRRAMRGLVPSVVLDRKDKIGFAPPQERWLRGPLAPWLADMLCAAEQRSDVFSAEGLRAARREFEAGGPDTMIWRVASTEAWFRHFLERKEAPCS